MIRKRQSLDKIFIKSISREKVNVLVGISLEKYKGRIRQEFCRYIRE